MYLRTRALYEASFNLRMTLLYCSVVPPLRQNLGDLSRHSIVPQGCSQLLLDVVLAPRVKQELRLRCRPKLSMFCHVSAPQIQVYTFKPVSDTAVQWVLNPGLKPGEAIYVNWFQNRLGRSCERAKPVHSVHVRRA